VHFNAGLEHRQHGLRKRRGVALDVTFKLKPLARAHNGHPMPAQISVDQHGVTWPDVLRPNPASHFKS
jgi:hypothetical protein